MAYVEGFLVPVPVANRDAYLELAARAAPLFREYGALEVVECWGSDLPTASVTDFRMAVKAEAARPSCSPGSSTRPRRCGTRPSRRSSPIHG